jgi:urease accessory protein
MLTLNKLVPAGRGLAPVLLKRATHVALDWDVRQKSRFDAVDSAGRALAVFLPRGTTVRGGDVLVAEDGSLVRVEAAPQPVMVVRHCTQHGSAFDLTRAAYHLGNRHVQIELKPDHLKIEPDHVLAAMLDRMHLIVSQETAPFEPEGGAYSGGHAHGHVHDHGHGHGHGHGHEHGPQCSHHGHDHVATHDHPHEHPHPHGSPARAHEHGHHCDHGHDHSQDHAHEHAHEREQAHRHDEHRGHAHGHRPGHPHD